MSNPFATSLVDLIMGLALAPADQESSNRFSLEGLSLGSGPGGALRIGVQRLTAAALRVASGALMSTSTLRPSSMWGPTSRPGS